MFTLKENKLNIKFELIGGADATAENVAKEITEEEKAKNVEILASLSNEAELEAFVKAAADGNTPPGLTDQQWAALKGEGEPVVETAASDSSLANAGQSPMGGDMEGGAIMSDLIRLVNNPAVFTATFGVSPQAMASALIQANLYGSAMALLGAINSPTGTDLTEALSAGDLEKWVRAGDDSHLEITKDGKTMNLAQYWSSEPGSKGGVAEVANLGICFNESTSGNFSSAPRNECDDLVVTPGAPGSDYAKLADLSQADVNKISPAVLFGILKYLGFQMANNNGLNEVQTYASWWTNLNQADKDKLKPTNVATHGLKPFLEKAIAFINANPAILNKGVESKCEDKAGYGLRCTQNKHNPRSFDEFRNQIDLTLNKFRGIPAGLLGVGSVGFVPYGMTGGAAVAVPIGLMPSASGRVGRLPEFTKQVRALYASFVSRLEAMKKTLSASTKTQIEEVFKQTQAKEDEAKKLLGWFEKYAQTTQMTGDRTSAVYGTQELKTASDNFAKVLGKYRRRLYSLVDIVSVASQAVNDAELKSMSM